MKTSNYKIIITLALGSVLLNLDRWIIAPLFPAMMKDLHFDYQDLGLVIGSTALTWGIASLFFGGLSDRLGRVKILVPALAGLSILSGITGLATGLGSMLLLRAFLGVFEGAYIPTAFAAVKDASTPNRVGINMGILGSGTALATGIAPIIATQVLPYVPSWHWVFVLVSIPGLMIAVALYFLMKDTPFKKQEHVEKVSIKEIFKYRNIRLGVLTLCGIMSGIFILSAMIPTYLTDYLKLNMTEMGFVASSIGFGGVVGAILIPALSDKFGRKPILIIALIIGLIAVYFFKNTGAETSKLFALLFLASACIIGSLVLVDGPIATETVPASMTGAASGIIIGIGEIFGGGVAPAISGISAQKWGIESILDVALVSIVFAIIFSFFLIETAPRKTNNLS